MLSSLYIENIAVIERASMDFERGFTALTGETGAGKSIIIDAIGAVLGERTSKELIRTGSQGAAVSALFTEIGPRVRELLSSMGIPCEEGELQIRRDIRPSRSTSKANGVPITAAMLKEIGKELISIHGQHDSYDLLAPEVHGRYIDTYGKNGELLERYQREYVRLRQIKNELDQLTMDESQRTRRIDLLTYQIKEIEDAAVRPGEREALAARRDSIRNGESILEALFAAKGLILGDAEVDGALAAVGEAADQTEAAAKSYEPLRQISEKLSEIRYLLEDVGEEIRTQADRFDFDPSELEEIEERLDLLYKLSLKYGESEEEILRFYDACCEELQGIQLSDERITLLSTEFEEVKERAVSLARELSHRRRDAGKRFAEGVKEELGFLNMPGVEFSVEQERVSLNSLGCDKIQFLVSANPGEEPKPMSKIASGGELSRIMLAIKTVLSDGDEIDTLIFDEVDTGISGEAARKVGLKLKEAAGERQVICITHLAQIAAMARNQMLIEKNTDGKKTFTSVTHLDREERVTELARMLSGNGMTPLKRRMAEEMLDQEK